MTRRRTITLDMNDGDMVINVALDEDPLFGVGATDVSFHSKTPVPLDRLGEVVGHMVDALRHAGLQQIADEIKAEVLGEDG